MFRKHFYDQAILCFQNSGDEDLKRKCLAYKEADRATSFNSKAEGVAWQSKRQQLNKHERKAARKEERKFKLFAKRHFLRAGKHFEAIGLIQQAATCAFSGEDYA